MRHPEYEMQVALCRYISLQYPDVLFASDTIASVRLTVQQASRNTKIQKKGFKQPDLVIFEPRGSFHGMFLELKVESPYKKNGDLKKNDHLEAQWKTIRDLRDKGYYANFSVGFDESIRQIDAYMRL